MLAGHDFLENGQVHLTHTPPSKKGVVRVIVAFLDEENDAEKFTKKENLRKYNFLK